jgi:hypothetical protein
MRTILRAAAVATAAVAAVAGTAGAASAAPRHYASLSAPHSAKAGHQFGVNGSGYDARTSTGVLCLEQRQLVHGHWGAWKWELCESHRSGHKVTFGATGVLNAGTYDLRLVLFSHPNAKTWKALDYSGQHVLRVHR